MAEFIPSDMTNLGHWLTRMRETHPRIQAARARALAARQRVEAVWPGFHDPEFGAATGYAEGPGEVPMAGLPRGIPADALSVQAGIEAPLWGGIYGGGGVAFRNVESDAWESGSRRGQSVAGMRLRMPLLRDRGFRERHVEDLLRWAELRAREAALRGLVCDMERDLVMAYAEWLAHVADAQEVIRAAERAEDLLRETTVRAELQEVPEDQVFPARLEVALRREELAASEQQIRLREATLIERLGIAERPALEEPTAREVLASWASATTSVPLDDTDWLAVALVRRGDALGAAAHVLSATAAVDAATEACKDDLSLTAGVAWERWEAGGEGLEESNRTGYEASLAFRRTLGRRSERAALAAAKAELDARLAEQAALEIQITAQIRRAETQWRSACLRLAMAQNAVVEARRVLEAESERFGLGEGTTRNVLDAQKDLTAATRRSVGIAAQVVMAMVELRHALGFGQQGE